jgi:hypothetical protein
MTRVEEDGPIIEDENIRIYLNILQNYNNKNNNNNNNNFNDNYIYYNKNNLSKEDAIKEIERITFSSSKYKFTRNQRILMEKYQFHNYIVPLLKENICEENVLLILIYFTRNVDNLHEIIIVNGLIETLANIISNYYNVKNDFKAQYAATAIANLAWNNMNQRILFLYPNVMTSLIQLMNNGNDGAKEQAGRAIGNIALASENERPLFLFPNLIESLIHVMINGSSELKEQASKSISNIAINFGNKRPLFLFPNLIESLVHIMNNSDNEGAIIQATKAIVNISVDPKSDRQLYLIYNLVDTLILLINHNNNEIKKQSIWAICHLSYDFDNQLDLITKYPFLINLIINYMIKVDFFFNKVNDVMTNISKDSNNVKNFINIEKVDEQCFMYIINSTGNEILKINSRNILLKLMTAHPLTFKAILIEKYHISNMISIQGNEAILDQIITTLKVGSINHQVS